MKHTTFYLTTCNVFAPFFGTIAVHGLLSDLSLLECFVAQECFDEVNMETIILVCRRCKSVEALQGFGELHV